ncbi:MAG: hypothetical protein QG632_277 [Candidatus Dependentiae bacterium]|nr:hypothetical protein [Candidatus Dependentiae bacterium]
MLSSLPLPQARRDLLVFLSFSPFSPYHRDDRLATLGAKQRKYAKDFGLGKDIH